MMANTGDMEVVIVGGGIIGVSIAYHLAKRGIMSTIIERSSIACAASGKAGGYLARHFSDGSPLEQLSKCSFDMHMKFSEIFTDVGYRRVETISISIAKDGRESKPVKSERLPSWLDGKAINGVKYLGSKEDSAQVHPFKLTTALLESATAMAGTRVQIGTVSGVIIKDGTITGVKIGENTMPANVVVLAMGPWTGKASEWLKLARITGDPYHSIVLSSTTPVTPHCVFTHFQARDQGIAEPEIYPRPDGTVYVCGEADKPALPDDPASITSNKAASDRLLHVARTCSSSLSSASIELSTSCYLPCSPDGLPLIGKIPGVCGAYVAAGHSCWGILNAPATGACMAELIVDGHCSLLDISPFDPARFE